ncbi:MAG: PAS domain S-box protein, partial [Gammaproteobacteria bacterium]|nr:PAS domain S-box protein [Gammaproteobacteria bacterium]
IGKSVDILVSDKHKKAHQDGLDRFIKTGEAGIIGKTVETVGLTKEGAEVPIEMSLSYQRFEKEQHQFTAIIRDITERKQSEKRLCAQYEVTKVLAESNTVKEAFPRILKTICGALDWDVGEIWEYDRLQNILYNTEIWHAQSLKVPEFKAATRQITFLPEIGLPGRVWESAESLWIEDVVHDTNFPRAAIADKEELHGAFGFPIIIGSEVLGTICFFSREIRKPDKDLLDMMVAIGRQIGLFIKRKQADVKLRKLSHAIEQSSNAIVITNAEGNVEYANPKFVQLTGYSIEETIGANSRILKSGKTPHEVYKELWGTITSGNEWKGELCNRKKSGGLYWEAVSISPVKNDEGVITSFIAVKDDITERKKMEEALLQSEKLKSIGTITAGIAHDFNNILAIISGTTQLLEVIYSDNRELTKELKIITEAAHDGAEISSKMLKFSKTGHSTKNFVPSDIRDLVMQAIDFIKPRWKNEAQAKGINYYFDKEGIKSVLPIICNPTEIREVFVNIINNALDAMPEGGTLSFSIWSVDGTVFISVSDTGEGMLADVKKNVFDPFFSTKGVAGTGLGL